MKPSRRKLEELLWIAGLHGPMRSIYAATVGRQAATAQARMAEFYRKLLPPNALVFDVGANMGVFSAAFASVGARVVALEPNSDCVRHIQLSFSEMDVQVIQAAAGTRDGLAVLNVSDAWDVTSSMSTEWMLAIQERDERYRGNWSRKSVVPMLTLDTLVEQFGVPDFVKIDVEGFEEEVLKGLSTQPRLLSFEFHSAFLPAALRCLESSLFSEESTFNLVSNPPWGYPEHFDSEAWLTRDEVRKRLAGPTLIDNQGDIFVRAPAR